jgi:hypothetical protein
MFAAHSHYLFVSLLFSQCVCNEYTSDPTRGDAPPLPAAPPVDIGPLPSSPTAAPTPIVDNCQRYKSTSEYYEMENPFGFVPFYQTCFVDDDCPAMNLDGTNKCCMAAFCFCKTTALAAQGIDGACVGNA